MTGIGLRWRKTRLVRHGYHREVTVQRHRHPSNWKEQSSNGLRCHFDRLMTWSIDQYTSRAVKIVHTSETLSGISWGSFGRAESVESITYSGEVSSSVGQCYVSTGAQQRMTRWYGL